MSSDPQRPRLVKREPPRLVVSYWRIFNPFTKKTAMCDAFAVNGGFELRLRYSDEDIIDSEVFQGEDAREVMDAYAAALMRELLDNGFTDVSVQ